MRRLHHAQPADAPVRLPHARLLTAAARHVVREPGAPLEPDTRGVMEARFGHDFRNVRVHNDARADASAREMRASAYTVGEHVVFGRGERARRGEALLAHELGHVIEQRVSGAAEPAVMPAAGCRRAGVGATTQPQQMPQPAQPQPDGGPGQVAQPQAITFAREVKDGIGGVYIG
ncbi:MAG: eCIS core domain-containing protein [Thermoanaerobaculia bacterium]